VHHDATDNTEFNRYYPIQLAKLNKNNRQQKTRQAATKRHVRNDVLAVLVCFCKGVLVYSHQEGVENGDFVVLNIVDEKLQLRYNLGSGAANIT